MQKNTQAKISASFLKLLISNEQRIYAYIVKRIPNSADAEDIMQEVAVTLWEEFHNFQLGTNFVSWALTITRNKIFNFIRKNKNSHVLFSSRTIEIFDKDASRDDQDNEVKKEILKKCLAKLHLKDRGLLQMRYSNMDITIKALSRQIGRPYYGLYSSLARIHNALVNCAQRKLITEEEN